MTTLSPASSRMSDPLIFLRVYLFLERDQIIHTGTMYVLLSIALNVSRRQRIAPVPLGTEALSNSLKAPVICVGRLMLF